MNNRPKRRKYKDNPYTLEISENGRYYVSFKDSSGKFVREEIDEIIFNTMDKFELLDLSELNEFDNHIEHSELYEETLFHRTVDKVKLVDEIVEEKMLNDELMMAINTLTDIQKRRIKKYYFEEKNIVQIAKEENCSKVAVKYSLDIAIEKLKEFFKK